jgi:hypothetical protein
MVRLNHALLAGAFLSKQSLDAMFTGYFHDSGNDPSSPWRGYQLIFFPTPATQNKVVWLAEVSGEGEDEAGLKAGLNMSVELSPVDGAMEIFVNNDDEYFNVDDENHFNELVSKLMWGK